MTTQAIGQVLNNGIDTVFVTYGGRYGGRLTGKMSRDAPLRVSQYQRSLDGGFCLALARQIVTAKLTNACRLLQRYSRNHRDASFEVEIRGIQDMCDRAAEAVDLPMLRGFEGKATSRFFASYRRMFSGEMGFTSRTRRPPRDEVNALLGIGYSVLLGEVLRELAAKGLDEFRHSAADMLVLDLANRGRVSREQFESGRMKALSCSKTRLEVSSRPMRGGSREHSQRGKGTAWI